MTIPPSVENLDILCQPSIEFFSCIDKSLNLNIFYSDYSFLKKELNFYCNGRGNCYIIFDNYKESLFLKKHRDFIKNLPKACIYNIDLNCKGQKSHRLLIDSDYTFSLSNECNKVFLRMSSGDPNFRNKAEEEFKEIIKSIEDRNDPIR